MLKKFTSLSTALIVLFLTLFNLPQITLGQTRDYSELYSATFTSLDAFSYTQNKSFTLSAKSWLASTCQVNSSVFYLGCSSKTASYGVLNNNSSFSNEVAALKSADSQYNSNNNYTTAHAYAMRFDNAYSNVTKVEFTWSGGNNAFQVYLFGDTGSGYVKLASTNYSSSSATTAGSVTWTGNATNFTKFAIVARPGTTSSVVTTNKTLRAATFTIYETSGGGTSVATPTFSRVSGESSTTIIDSDIIKIDCETDGATIYYTMGENPADPTNESTEYDPDEGIEVDESTTIKAIAYVGEEASDVASITYTVITPLKTMDQIIAQATTNGNTAKPVYVTFNNWVVSGVKNTQAFVTDGTKGFVAYKSGSGNTTGFVEGNVLSGTAQVSLQLYNGFSEFTTLTSSTTGLTVTTGGTTSPQVVTINSLSGVNTGAVITLNGLTYNSSNQTFSDGVNTIKSHTTFYTGSYTNGHIYNITGIYQQQSSAPHRILPRSAADIVDITPRITTDLASPIAFTYVGGEGPDEKDLAITGLYLTTNISATLTNNQATVAFEMTDGVTTGSELTLDSEGAVITLRLKSGLAIGSYSATLSLASTGATTVNITLNGTVTTPTHDIEQYSLPSIKPHGTITYSPNPAPEGGSITLTATPYPGYDFVANSWVFYKEDGGDIVEDNSITVTDNVITMPAYDIWVDATFTEHIATFTNGVYEETLGTEASFNHMKNVNVTGENTWYFESQYSCATIEGASTGDKDWMITPKMQVDNGKLAVSFKLWQSDAGLMAVKWSTSSDISGEWNLLSFSESTTGSWVTINKEITTNANNIYVAFIYDNTSTGTEGEYSIKSFTARQFYDVTFDKNLVSATGSMEPLSCTAGIATTLTANAFTASGKAFTGWNTAPNGSGDAYDDEDEITLTSNITLYAQWVDTHTISYKTNGYDEVTTKTVNHGAQIGDLLEAPTAKYIPAGYTFKGWFNGDYALNDAAPTYVATTDIVNSDMTLKAVFAIGTTTTSEQAATWSLDKDDFSTGGYSTNNTGVTKDGITYVFARCYQNAGIQMEKNNGEISNTNELISITSITINAKTNSVNVYQKASSSSSYSKITNISNGVYTFSTGMKYFKVKADNGAYAVLNSITLSYVKSATSTTYSCYCTSVSPQTAISGTITDGHLTTDGTIAAGTAVYLTTPLTINSGKKLTVNGALGNDNPANLIIEDGGQLILKSTNAGVQATFQKTIEDATAKGIADHWYTISTPTGGIDVDDVVNLVDNEGHTLQYNLFRYKESTHMWEAYNTTNHADFTTLEKGRGYLYRNNGQDLEFPGEVNVGSVTVHLTNTEESATLRGFNLIGNPYGHNIYKGVGAAIAEAKLNNGFYYLTDKGAWQTGTYETPITPKMGILVQLNNSYEELDLTITDKTTTASAERYANDNLMFTVSNKDYEDVTYAMFHKGYGLNKINHRNADIPMIYINQDNEDYALAMLSDDTKSFNLCFKAKTTGQYKLTYKAEGEFSYLHVIDRLTGNDVDMLLEGEYNFIGTPHDNENRFIVSLGYLPDYGEGNNDIFAFQSGNEVLVSGEGELQIFDVTGRSVMTTTINGVEALQLPTTGMYIFRLIGSEIKTQKIVVR